MTRGRSRIGKLKTNEAAWGGKGRLTQAASWATMHLQGEYSLVQGPNATAFNRLLAASPQEGYSADFWFVKYRKARAANLVLMS